MIYRIPEEHLFPDPSHAEPSGLLGVGGDLDPERLLLGYRLGIFPWYSEDPILWWSPDPRFVLQTSALVVPRSLAKRIRQRPYRITVDRAFEEVITRCATARRREQAGTWITPEMETAFVDLHALGYAHSVEAWEGDVLVGGLYGVGIGRFYSGESMFADRPDASKIAFVHLVRQLVRWGFPIVDCQVPTQHLERFGAAEIPRTLYLASVRRLCVSAGRQGRWSFDEDFVCDG